jgi:hypothetical protein
VLPEQFGLPLDEPPVGVGNRMISLVVVAKRLGPPPEECPGAIFPPGIAGQLDLQADELGAVEVAVLLQPVGVDEAGGIVIGGCADRLEEGRGDVHTEDATRNIRGTWSESDSSSDRMIVGPSPAGNNRTILCLVLFATDLDQPVVGERSLE